MATYYWVGTSGGTWDTSTTTNWATTSGGAGGAGVPGSADTAIFDSHSGSTTVTTSSSPAVSITALTLNTGFVGTVTFGGGFTASGIVTLSQGTLNTNGQTCAWGSFASSTSVARTLTMGASTITLSTGTSAWNVNVTSLTVTANTATVTCTGASTTFYPGGVTYPGTTFVLTGTGGATIENNLICANLSFIPSSNATNNYLYLAGTVTLSGTLTLTGAAPPNRILVQSSTVGTSRSVVCNGTVVASYVDFMDISASGTASWNLSAITGGSGNCLGNSGITFTAEVDQVWNGNTTGNWSNAANWTSRVPLPQDNATINALTSGTITTDTPRLGNTISFSGSTGAPGQSNSILRFSATIYRLVQCH